MMGIDRAQAELATFFQRRPDVDWGDGLAEALLFNMVREITLLGDDWSDEETDVQELLDRAFAKLPRHDSANQTRH